MEKERIEKEFIDMVIKNERIVYKVCSFYITESYSIGDLYQEVICNLWAAYPKFRQESTVSTWMYRIALNTCISGLRKDKRRIQHESLSASQLSIPEPEDMSEQIKEMYRLINLLRTMEKAIVLLYLEEKSYQEIADITGLTLSNVATKLKRAKVKLSELSKL